MEAKIKEYFERNGSLAKLNSCWTVHYDKLVTPSKVFYNDKLYVIAAIILFHDHEDELDSYHYDFEHKSKCKIKLDRLNKCSHVELVIDEDDFDDRELRRIAHDLAELFIAQQAGKFYKSDYILKRVHDDGRVESVKLFEAFDITSFNHKLVRSLWK